jgi:AbrB family looped-hinge helix DNA binding protein
MSRMTKKGQVTIPKGMRDQFDLKPGSEIAFGISRDRELIVKPKRPVAKEPVESRFAALRGTLKLGMTTDEFMRFLRGDPDDDYG